MNLNSRTSGPRNHRSLNQDSGPKGFEKEPGSAPLKRKKIDEVRNITLDHIF